MVVAPLAKISSNAQLLSILDQLKNIPVHSEKSGDNNLNCYDDFIFVLEEIGDFFFLQLNSDIVIYLL